MRIGRADLRCPKFQEMPSSVTVGWGLPASPTSGQHELPADAFLVTLVSGPRCLSQAQDWPSGLGLSQPRLRTFSDWFGRLPPCPHSIVDWPSLERGWQLGILHWPWQGAHCPPALMLAQWPSHRIHGRAIPVPRSPRLLSARQPGDAPGARASGGHGGALGPEPHASPLSRSIPSPGIRAWPRRVRFDPSGLPTWALVAPVSVHEDSARVSSFLAPGLPANVSSLLSGELLWWCLHGRPAADPRLLPLSAFAPQGWGCCFDISFTALQVLSHFWALWFLRGNLSSDLVFERKRSLARSLCCRGLWGQF